MSHSNAYTRSSRCFTLVEVMVGLALLLLMMSFLFEFVLSGQKLWRASEHKLLNFEDGQIVLDLVGDDLRNVVYDNEVGRSMPFYKRLGYHTLDVKSKGQNVTVTADVYMFFTQFTDGGDTYKRGIYPVCYVYIPYDSDQPDGSTARLYRIPVDQTVTDWTLYNEDFGEKKTTMAGLPASGFPVSSLGDKLLEDNVLMHHVSAFEMEIPAGTWASNGWFLKEAPRAVQVRFKVFSKDAIPQDEWEGASPARKRELMNENERSFSRTIRID